MLLIAIVVLVIYTLNSVGPVIVSVSEARIRALTTSAVNSAIFEVMTHLQRAYHNTEGRGHMQLDRGKRHGYQQPCARNGKQTETYMEAIGEQVIKIPVGTLSGSPLLFKAKVHG